MAFCVQHFPFRQYLLHEKNHFAHPKNGGVLEVEKKNQQTKKQVNTENEKRPGYGDKKLEGPNRPAE